MASMANQFGMRNPASIMGGGAEEAASGDTETYAWKQVGDDIEITFKRTDLSKADKASVKVNFARQHLKAVVKGDVLIDAELAGQIVPDDSTWTLSDGVLQLTMEKANSGPWPKLVA